MHDERIDRHLYPQTETDPGRDDGKMASPTQEIATLKEEIGFQKAILASLAESQDAESRAARINARREIQLLVDRLRQIQRMLMLRRLGQTTVG